MNYTPSYTPKWQDERNQLNHVWFQNYVFGVLNGHYTKRTLERAGYADIIREQWLSRIEKAQELIATMEEEMSPANLLDHMKYLRDSSEDMKKMMRPMLHEKWMGDYKISELQEQAQHALDELVAAFPAFDATVEGDRVTQAEVEAFAKKCKALSDAIHNFPTKVWI